jgi:uncharacterized protein
MRHAGCELSVTCDGRGEGVFATRRFKPGQTTVGGEVERRLNTNHSHATQVGLDEYVQLSGLGSKVNHSCDPNCGVSVNAAGAPDLVARREIQPGEEITFDYAMRNYSIEHFRSRCLCGAAACRGTITGWKDLPPHRKAAYQGLIAPYLLDLEPTADRDPDGGAPAGRR